MNQPRFSKTGPEQPDRLIPLRAEKRGFLEAKQTEYRKRLERAEAEAVSSVVDDAYYKLVVLGILLRRNEVTIGDAFDEIASADGPEKINHSLLENAFQVIEAYNRGELERVVTMLQKREQKRPS